MQDANRVDVDDLADPLDQWLTEVATPVIDEAAGQLLEAAYQIGGRRLRRAITSPERAFALLDDLADVLADVFLAGVAYGRHSDDH